MFDSLIPVARQVAILFALIAVGYGCNRARLFGRAAVRGMVELLVTVVTPAVMVNAFQRPFDRAALSSFAIAFAAAGAIHLLGWGASRLVGGEGLPARRKTLQMAVVFSNAGFMGLPLEQAVLGDGGVFFGAVYVAVFNVLIWTYGVAHMSGGVKDVRLRAALLNPGVAGLALSMPLFLCSVRLPSALGAPVRMLADLNTPLAMLVIGYYLAEARFRAVLTCARAYAVAALRLIAVPLATVAAFWLLARAGARMERDMVLAMVIAASAPVAALVTAFSVKFARDVELSVGLVAITTLLSLFTMPPVIAFAKHVL